MSDDRELRAAAETLFSGSTTVGAAHREAVEVFAGHDQPYHDAPRGRYVVSSYALTRSVLQDRRLGNDLQSARDLTNSRRLHAQLDAPAPSLLFIDPPEHDSIKVELARLFTGARLRELRPVLATRWREALAHFVDGGGGPLGATAVHPICVEATCAVLGLRLPQDVPSFVEDLYELNKLFDLEAEPDQLARSREAERRVRVLVSGALPGSPVAERMAAGAASDDVILSTVVFMLRAGVVTVGSLLLSLLAEQLGSERPPGEVDDLLVRHTPTGDTGRVTSEEVVLGGVRVPRGSTVIALINAANAALAKDRATAAGHLVFGAGAHRCVAERLVRLHVEAAVDAIAALDRHYAPTATRPHRTGGFRGYREIVLQEVR